MAVREKKELAAKAEKTVPGRYFVPAADIYETDDALAVVMEMPGVEKKDLEVALENDVLRVDGRIDFSKYKDMEPRLRRVQRRPFRALVHALGRNRPGEDRRQSRRRGADADPAEGQARPAAQDRDRMRREAGTMGGRRAAHQTRSKPNQLEPFRRTADVADRGLGRFI